MRPTAGLLLLALAAVTAGCAAPGSLTMERVDDDRLADRGHRSLAAVAEDPHERRFAELVRAAIADGSATTMDRAAPPIGTTYPLRDGDRYYVVDRTTVWTGPAVRVALRIDYNVTASGEDPIRWASLSEGDREIVRRALRERGDVDALEPGYDAVVTAPYTPDERANSTLLDADRTAVAHEGAVYPVAVTEGAEVDAHRYRYDVEQVAEDEADFVGWLRRERTFVLEDLADDERRIVEAAIDDSYLAGDTDDAAFRSLVQRFRRHEPVEIREGNGAQYVVRYRNRTYWARMRFEGYV